MEEGLNVIIRDADQEDLPLIYNSWLKQYRESPFAVGINNGVYYSQHRKVIDHLITHAIISVACDPNDPTKIYSWACGEAYDTPVVHFVYTKKDYRGKGLAKMLLKEFGWESDNHVVTTHFMKYRNAKHLNKEKKIVYNPYLLYVYMSKGLKNETQVNPSIVILV